MDVESTLTLILVLGLFLGLLAVRMHVGLSLMLAGLIGVVLLRGTGAAVSTASQSRRALAWIS